MQWQWSVATGHPEVNVHLSQKLFLRVRWHVGRAPIAVRRRVATFAIVAVLSQFVVKRAFTVFE